MALNLTPRAMIKSWLAGEELARPLLMPIVFSLAARLDNLPVRDFLSNPTKIANALRQVRSVLKIDGVCCHHDPLLLPEVLGCKREWHADGSCTLADTDFDIDCDVLSSAEEVARRGPMPVACEVVRRLRVMLPDEPALMVALTGPAQLAAKLSPLAAVKNCDDLNLAALATDAVTSVSKALLEAGADVILLQEDFHPGTTLDYDEYVSLLQPAINMIRFYDAMPVLMPGTRASDSCISPLRDLHEACLIACSAERAASSARPTHCGLTLPNTFWFSAPESATSLSSLAEGGSPVLLTSETDLDGADLKPLLRTFTALRAAAFKVS